MSRLKTRRHAVDIIFTLTLFCVLAASSILVMVMGVHVYQGIAQRMSTNFDLRTSLSYISTKLRQCDTSSPAYIDDFGGCKTIVVDEMIDGEMYRTRIYEYGGSLRELFTSVDLECVPEDGEPIMEIEGLDVEQRENGLLKVSVVDSRNNAASFIIHPRCSQQAGTAAKGESSYV